MYASDFVYDGMKLSDYGMIIASMDNDTDGTVSSGGDVTFNTVKPTGSNKFALYSAVYEEVFTDTFQIFKNPCESDDPYLSPMQVSELQNWLCRDKFYKFKIDQDDMLEFYWMASFSTKVIRYNGRPIGLELTLTTDAPFAYEDDIKRTFEIARGGSVPVYNLSDHEGKIYPNLTITVKEAGTFRLENMRDMYPFEATTDDIIVDDKHLGHTVFQVKNCVAGEVLTIDSTHKVITSSVRSALGSDCNYLFPYIISSFRGTPNYYRANLGCSVTISYAPIRKISL